MCSLYSPGLKKFIYDRGCRFAAYADKREFQHFSGCVCQVDLLHQANHVACSCSHFVGSQRSATSPPLRPDFVYCNTQAVEQVNARMKRLQTSVSFMSPETAMTEVRMLLGLLNIRKRMSVPRAVGIDIPLPIALLSAARRTGRTSAAAGQQAPFARLRWLLFGDGRDGAARAKLPGAASGIAAVTALRQLSIAEVAAASAARLARQGGSSGSALSSSTGGSSSNGPSSSKGSSTSSSVEQPTAVPKRTVDERRLARRLSSAGLRPRLDNVREDGNCLFDSLVDQFAWSQKAGDADTAEWNNDLDARVAASNDLRSLLGQLIQSSPVLLNFLSVSERNELFVDGKWGTHVHLVAAADYFQRDIVVLSSAVAGDFTLITPASGPSRAAAASNDPFVLAHWQDHGEELHYGSLVPIDVGAPAFAAPAPGASFDCAGSADVHSQQQQQQQQQRR